LSSLGFRHRQTPRTTVHLSLSAKRSVRRLYRLVGSVGHSSRVAARRWRDTRHLARDATLADVWISPGIDGVLLVHLRSKRVFYRHHLRAPIVSAVATHGLGRVGAVSAVSAILLPTAFHFQSALLSFLRTAGRRHVLQRCCRTATAHSATSASGCGFSHEAVKPSRLDRIASLLRLRVLEIVGRAQTMAPTKCSRTWPFRHRAELVWSPPCTDVRRRTHARAIAPKTKAGQDVFKHEGK